MVFQLFVAIGAGPCRSAAGPGFTYVAGWSQHGVGAEDVFQHSLLATMQSCAWDRDLVAEVSVVTSAWLRDYFNFSLFING